MAPTLFLAQSPESNLTSRSSLAVEHRRGIDNAVQVPGGWLLDSPCLEDVVRSARRLARLAGAPILLQGERGLGVAELARLVHEEDPVARDKRFRIVPAHRVKAAGRPVGEQTVDPAEAPIMLPSASRHPPSVATASPGLPVRSTLAGIS